MRKNLYILSLLILTIFMPVKQIAAKGFPTLTFDGRTGTFTSSDLIYMNFNNVVPGDKIEETFNFRLKNISETTKVYLDINGNNVDIPEEITYNIFVDDKLLLEGINSTLSSYLLYQTDKDANIEFKILVDVPTTVGNEIKNLDKENIWTFIVEDNFGRHEMVITGVDQQNNNLLFSGSISLIFCLSIYLIHRMK